MRYIQFNNINRMFSDGIFGKHPLMLIFKKTLHIRCVNVRIFFFTNMQNYDRFLELA